MKILITIILLCAPLLTTADSRSTTDLLSEIEMNKTIEESEAAKIARIILGELFTGVTNVTYISKSKANVSAYVSKTKCKMTMINTDDKVEIGGNHTGWKLDEIECN